MAKKYLSNSTATAFNDPRLTLVHADAAQFVKDKRDEYDVVIVDSSDPVGPAVSCTCWKNVLLQVVRVHAGCLRAFRLLVL